MTYSPPTSCWEHDPLWSLHGYPNDDDDGAAPGNMTPPPMSCRTSVHSQEGYLDKEKLAVLAFNDTLSLRSLATGSQAGRARAMEPRSINNTRNTTTPWRLLAIWDEPVGARRDLVGGDVLPVMVPIPRAKATGAQSGPCTSRPALSDLSPALSEPCSQLHATVQANPQ